MMEEFFPWEEKYGLIGDTVEGFAYWNYMRRDLFKSFRDDMDGIVSPFFRNLEESGQKKSFVKRLSLALRMLRMPGRTGKKDIDVLFLCHPRRTEIDGKLFSIYTDPLTEVFPNSVSVERASPERAKGMPFSPNLIYLDRLELFSMLFQMGMARFRKKRYREIREEMEKRLGGPLRELESTMGLKLKIPKVIERTTELFFLYHRKKPALEKMLDRLKPKVIVEVVGGSFDAKIINELAAEKGIPTMELQHGSLGPTIMYPEGISFPQFPAYYLVFSEYWKRFARFPIPPDHVIPVGFPYFEKQVKAYREKHRKKAQEKTAVFLSSPSYGREFSRAAVEFAAMAGKEIHVIYKLHPKEAQDWRNRYPELAASQTEVIDRPEVSIYEVFSRSDIQVGVESTAIYEGLAFGLKTFILRLPQSYLMEGLCEKGYGTFVESAAELMEALKNGEAAGETKTDEFWEKDAMEKTVTAIRSVMENKRA